MQVLYQLSYTPKGITILTLSATSKFSLGQYRLEEIRRL